MNGGSTPAADSACRWAWIVTQRAIIHLDLDAFYASVEQLRRPELRGLPVIVGGAPSGDGTAQLNRGVVSAASYEARAHGVHSAMPLRTALRMCPQAIVVPVDFRAYRDASKAVFDVARDYTPGHRATLSRRGLPRGDRIDPPLRHGAAHRRGDPRPDPRHQRAPRLVRRGDVQDGGQDRLRPAQAARVRGRRTRRRGGISGAAAAAALARARTGRRAGVERVGNLDARAARGPASRHGAAARRARVGQLAVGARPGHRHRRR